MQLESMMCLTRCNIALLIVILVKNSYDWTAIFSRNASTAIYTNNSFWFFAHIEACLFSFQASAGFLCHFIIHGPIYTFI